MSFHCFLFIIDNQRFDYPCCYYFGNQEAQIGCVDTLLPLKSKEQIGLQATATT